VTKANSLWQHQEQVTLQNRQHETQLISYSMDIPQLFWSVSTRTNIANT